MHQHDIWNLGIRIGDIAKGITNSSDDPNHSIPVYHYLAELAVVAEHQITSNDLHAGGEDCHIVIHNDTHYLASLPVHESATMRAI